MASHPSHLRSFWKSPAGLALAIVLAVGGFLLYQEHEAHVWGILPYLLLLACPVMHVFMHRGHRHDHHHHGEDRDEQQR